MLMKLLKMKSKSEEKIRIGLLIDEFKFDYYSYQIIKLLSKERNKYSIFFIKQNLSKTNFFLHFLKIDFF